MRDSERDLLATVVQQQGSLAAAGAPESTFVLTVTEGPEKGATIRIDESLPTRMLIGTSPACQIRLTDRAVSRRHAGLERVGHALKVADLSSTNGTFVDRVKIVEAELQGGEYLRVGATMLRVDLEDTLAGLPPDPAAGALSFGRLIGASREMRRIYPLAHALAHATVPLVIEGETGTGKEALAESIHEMGPRASGPFVVFDCTAVPPTLVESELFGHERGAFTGATSLRRGVFEQAHGGTLLIDEIGDLDLALQPKLLRAIERSEVRRVGGDAWIRVDVRVLAATRRDLDREVQAGRFRDDLFHRLAVARIELPALRNRVGDIPVLATHLWRQMGGEPQALTQALLRKWEDYGFPGNIRELKNTIARQLALGDLANVTTTHTEARRPLPPRSPSASPDAIDGFVDVQMPFPQARDRMLEEFEQRYVARVLALHGGDVARAAAASGIGRRYFQKLKARGRRGSE